MITEMEEPEMRKDGMSAKYENISSQVLGLLHYEIMFTLEQRRQGAVVIHFLVCLYAFAALAILCDDYFCASLDKICKRLKIHPDVAGATFMAAGSSMPTMFISVTSVFLDEGDIGLGTIIGSTMFNILFITGICGVAVSAATDLKPYSILRDAMFYVVYLSFLLVAMYDGMIHWYEAAIVSTLYGFYVLVMCYNTTLEHHFNAWAKKHFHQTRHIFGSSVKSPLKQSLKSRLSSAVNSLSNSPRNPPLKPSVTSTAKPAPRSPGHESPPKSPTELISKSPHESPRKSLNKSSIESPAKILNDSFAKSLSNDTSKISDGPSVGPTTSTPKKIVPKLDNAEGDSPTDDDDDQQTNLSDVRSVFSDTDSTLPQTKYDEEPENALSCPSGRWERVWWFIMFPIRVLYYVTIPDCRLESWENWYLVTFLMSIAWMGAHSYVLVWAVSVIGATIGIPECIMGLTLLAAGSSVPDAIASLVMARQGMGDMALANAIGSNIFDMLCLSMPWLFSTTIVHPNSIVMINGGNIVYVSLTLFGTVITTIIILCKNKWRLDRRLGCAMLIAYAFFLTTAVLIESYPRAKKIKHPLHRSDLPNKGLGVPHPQKHKVKQTGFTWI